METVEAQLRRQNRNTWKLAIWGVLGLWALVHWWHSEMTLILFVWAMSAYWAWYCGYEAGQSHAKHPPEPTYTAPHESRPWLE